MSSNFWNLSDQDGAASTVASHFGFSNRLIQTIVRWDVIREFNTRKKKQQPEGHGTAPAVQDEEKGQDGPAKRHKSMNDADMELMNVVQDSLHYTSIDRETDQDGPEDLYTGHESCKCELP
jgi:hypothetical protein